MQVISGDNLTKDKWNNFVAESANDFGLLQSWEWGDFQASLGRQVFKVAVVNGDDILALALIIKQPLKLGRSYFYIPRGPVLRHSIISDISPNFSVIPAKAGIQVNNTGSPINSLNSEFSGITNILFQELEKLAKQEKAIFLRLDPAWLDPPLPPRFVRQEKLRYVGPVQPKSTLILDLTKSEDELLSKMKPKTRYNIKVAKKNKIVIDKGEKYFEDFWALMQKTSGRQEIKSHSKNYYQKLLSILGQTKLAELIVAKFENKVIAANIIININHWSVYLYGASDYAYRSQMAPYLLHWQSIIEAKKSGAKHYDFWGVDEKKWPGITRFKNSFDPEKKFTGYTGAWDQVYSELWYNIYNLMRNLKISNF